MNENNDNKSGNNNNSDQNMDPYARLVQQIQNNENTAQMRPISEGFSLCGDVYN